MQYVKIISDYAIPAIFILIIIYGINNNISVYDTFIDGAKQGITTIVSIIPPLVALMVAVCVFRSSGALDLLIFLIKPATSALNIPTEALALFLIRPISGSASLAVVSDIMNTYGPDSFIGKVVCTMMGSTETVLYTLSVYFGAIGIRKIRYTLFAVIIADIVGLLISVWICRITTA